MVNFALPALAALALAQLTGATPVAASSSTFSFSKWVDGILANPNGDNLTPEEAVEAWKESLNETSAVATRGNLLQKRADVCNTIPGTEAYIPDAVACIDYLARLGSQECRVRGYSQFISIGRARIFGIHVDIQTPETNDIARAAGQVMDGCARADNTVQGADYAYGNGHIYVWIQKPE
ncbi:hypothetical protein LY78DRAFT_645670 [Colletotrichum sublineola]|nr:hypothetical protein LY78DRAFT_645670 [Colletotrichum sublineola]